MNSTKPRGVSKEVERGTDTTRRRMAPRGIARMQFTVFKEEISYVSSHQ